MTHTSVLPRKGFGLVVCLFFAAMLSGCIALDCKGCQRCGTGPEIIEGCQGHAASEAEKVQYGCSQGGTVCNPGRCTTGLPCKTVVNGGVCACPVC